jgi:FkbM family methyltransferase
MNSPQYEAELATLTQRCAPANFDAADRPTAVRRCVRWATDKARTNEEARKRVFEQPLSSTITATNPPFNFTFQQFDADMDDVDALGYVEPQLSRAFHENSWRCCAGGRGLVVDIGANYGWFTMLGVSLGCDVIAFEPVPANVALTRRNLANNPQFASASRVELRRNVVHAASDGRTFTLSVPIPHVHSPKGWRKPLGMIGMHGAAGLIKGMSGSWLHYNVSATAVTVDEVVLPRLRALGPHGKVCMLKVDVEGYEPEALATARGLLQSGAVSAVQLELNVQDRKRVHRCSETPRSNSGLAETLTEPRTSGATPLLRR